MVNECASRLRHARTNKECWDIFAGYMENIIGQWLLYFGVLTLNNRLEPRLAEREGDALRWQPDESDIDEMCRVLAESPTADAILNEPKPTPSVQVKEEERGGVGTVRFFRIGGHAVVIVVTSVKMPHPLPVDFTPALLEFAVRLRQLELEHMAVGAVSDVLTRLLTKGAYQAETRRRLLLACTRRSATSVAYMDLDNFKQLNSVLGYHDADRVVASVGGLIKNSIEGNSRVSAGRFGGDEFMFTFDSDAHYAEGVMQVILDRLANIKPDFTHKQSADKFRLFGGCKASVGIATCRFGEVRDGNYDILVAKAVDDVNKKANDALLKAKERKNCIVVYPELLVSDC